MCNEYARQIALAKWQEEMARGQQPDFEWQDGRIPNDVEAKPSLKIRDLGLVVRLEGDTLVGQMLPWAWYGPGKKPVFNFVSEGRDFSASYRVLILATGFYEHSAPAKPGVKLMDRFFFTMRDQSWHWIAGIVKEDCFTMVTREPGPDVAPYHKRSIVPLPPAGGLTGSRSPARRPKFYRSRRRVRLMSWSSAGMASRSRQTRRGQIHRRAGRCSRMSLWQSVQPTALRLRLAPADALPSLRPLRTEGSGQPQFISGGVADERAAALADRGEARRHMPA